MYFLTLIQATLCRSSKCVNDSLQDERDSLIKKNTDLIHSNTILIEDTSNLNQEIIRLQSNGDSIKAIVEFYNQEYLEFPDKVCHPLRSKLSHTSLIKIAILVGLSIYYAMELIGWLNKSKGFMLFCTNVGHPVFLGPDAFIKRSTNKKLDLSKNK